MPIPKRLRAGVVALALTDSQADLLLELLGQLQDYLDSAIESEVPEGEDEPRDPERRAPVAMLRARSRQAEDFKLRIEVVRLAIERSKGVTHADS
jgi:hypothetical protein